MFEEDEQLLCEQAKSCKDSKEQNRYFAIHALTKGHSVPLVSEIFCVDESTIRTWIKKWKKHKNLQDDPKYLFNLATVLGALKDILVRQVNK